MPKRLDMGTMGTNCKVSQDIDGIKRESATETAQFFHRIWGFGRLGPRECTKEAKVVSNGRLKNTCCIYRWDLVKLL